MKLSRLFFLAAISLGLLSAGPAAAVEYTFSILPAPPGKPTGWGRQTIPVAVNNSGQIAGLSKTNEDQERRPTLWSGLVPSVLEALPGSAHGLVYALNDAGQVAGAAISTGAYGDKATVWTGGRPAVLGALGGNTDLVDAAAYAINAHGQVAGSSTLSAFSPSHATLWNGSTATDLGTLGGTWSEARALNNRGQVVGGAETGSNELHAALWQGGGVSDLGGLGGAFSRALDINDAGQIVGYATFAGDSRRQATLWNGSTATALGRLEGRFGNFSTANAINQAGQVVGSSETGDDNDPWYEGKATLWENGIAIDLNMRLDPGSVAAGWRLLGAQDINDHGVIVGSAWNVFDLKLTGYVLTPVPEPDSIVLLLAGMGLLGYVSLRVHGQMSPSRRRRSTPRPPAAWQ